MHLELASSRRALQALTAASHACRSCRANTIGQVHIKNQLNRFTDIPMMQLVSDMVDIRDYSEAQWKAQIGAFIEALSARRP